MNKQPKTIKQLNRRLKHEYIEYFPYGRYKFRLVKDVAQEDPSYVCWWSSQIGKQFPIDPAIVSVALLEREHDQLFGRRGNLWRGAIGDWDHWGDFDDDWYDSYFDDFGEQPF